MFRQTLSQTTITIYNYRIFDHVLSKINHFISFILFIIQLRSPKSRFTIRFVCKDNKILCQVWACGRRGHSIAMPCAFPFSFHLDAQLRPLLCGNYILPYSIVWVSRRHRIEVVCWRLLMMNCNCNIAKWIRIFFRFKSKFGPKI